MFKGLVLNVGLKYVYMKEGKYKMKARMKRKVALDIGYGYVKGAVEVDGKVTTVMFPSVVKDQPLKSFNMALNGGYSLDYAVRVNDFKMFVGDLAFSQSAERKFEKQGNFDAKYIQTVVGTCLHLLVPSDCDVELILGLPLVSFSSEQAVNNIKNCVENQVLEVEIGKKTKKFILSKVKVTAQGIGAYFGLVLSDGNLYDQSIAILDLGYRTFDVTVIQSGVINEGLTKSFEEAGMNQLYEVITESLNSEGLQRKFKPSQIETYIRKDDKLPVAIKGKSTYREYAMPFMKNYVSNTISELRRYWADELNSIDKIYAVGGGGEELYDLFKGELEIIDLIKNSQYANCYGYLKQ